MNEQLMLNGRYSTGFGSEQQITPPPTAGSSPWTVAIVTSALSAATSWALESMTARVRGRR